MRLYQRLHPGVNLGPTDPENHEEAEEKIFGFWIFLMSDLVLFSVLFATEHTRRCARPEPEGHF
jgi:cytochrome o ubiquinol oxidase subunit 3